MYPQHYYYNIERHDETKIYRFQNEEMTCGICSARYNRKYTDLA